MAIAIGAQNFAPTLGGEAVIDDVALSYFSRRARTTVGLDLDSYKTEQVRRRLTGLMASIGVRNLVELAQRLESDKHLVERFRHGFTIHVTEFFRDPESFKNVERVVLPALARRARPAQVWSAGCSLGAEALSLAIQFDRAGMPLGRLLATDVCGTTVGRARAGGPFDAREVRNMPEGEMAHHLQARDGTYWVTSRLHSRIEFKVHDLLADAYPRQMDLVVCRNVLIYFEETTKNNVLAGLAGALRPGGFLFLGGTEIVHAPESLGLVRRQPSLYEKLGT